MGLKRNVYLEMISLEEAKSETFRHFPGKITGTETVSVENAAGRILAEGITARASSPAFHSSAMDGIAVKAENTYGAGETTPLTLREGIDAFSVNTGHLLPDGCNAVIMIENLCPVSDGIYSIEAPAFPWQHVRKTGEDIVATELLFPRSHTITPYCIGALISGGIFEVKVLRRPKILVIPTGKELLDWRSREDRKLKPGQVYESNAYVLKLLAEKAGAEAERHTLVTDDPGLIAKTVTEAADASSFDIIMIIGGSSAGSEDYARSVIDREGEVFVHGVTIMPGKPLLFGAVRGRPVFGIPGYPVSAIIAFEQFVEPLIHHMAGTCASPRETADVETARKLNSKLGIEEFVRVKIGRVGGRLIATPLPGGAGSITSVTEADGVVRIPADTEGVGAGETLRAELLSPRSVIEETVVAVGSHDNTLDILADQIRAGAESGRITLSSSHVGSMGGLMALKKGLCHIAGIHLLDPDTGGYNLSYVKKYLPDRKIRLINLVIRDQGLITPKGNPKKICGIEDLIRKDIRFINRQAGSGTRILLDYRLEQLGISKNRIDGYDRDEYTHMSVAVSILSGAADTGLGIYAAAKALDLDFIPVVTEQYDLAIEESVYNTEKIKRLLETITSDAFRKRVGCLGGYSTEKTGVEVIVGQLPERE